ncbi:integrase core domain-containing protein [Hirsutella rhossiliensis]|uniref:Integrase core domain-containing protein n=1 Tax=Hirsutella rhossiliensis TaxID=111463 RepID=A0A9P8N6R3_9HYPO|nr:integrase core domain-containing protein [Hirsutella rhossiliensis]KAH0967779.1 integrase core domain-containing protein [Hirsutella rhossiliensis]
MHRQIARRPPTRTRDQPCQELWIDWTDLDPNFEDYVRIMFVTDAYSGMVFPYFMRTHGSDQESLAVLRDFVDWMKNRHGFCAKVIRSDGELFTKRVRGWLRQQGITAEKSAANTPAQNGGAERSGGAVTEKSRAMRISANLPHDLWKEIVEAACYLKNKTPRESNEWRTPHELFFKKQPQLAHLKAYGCRAYAMTSEAQLKQRRLRKLDPRAHIGYLVGYESSNIFKIWVPHKGKVILTRDVIFDEGTFFDGKDIQPELLETINQLVQKVEVPESQQSNAQALEEEIEDDAQSTIFVNTDELGNEDLTDKEDYDRLRDLEAALISPPPSEPEESLEAVFSVHLPVSVPEGVGDQPIRRNPWNWLPSLTIQGQIMKTVFKILIPCG